MTKKCEENKCEKKSNEDEPFPLDHSSSMKRNGKENDHIVHLSVDRHCYQTSSSHGSDEEEQIGQLSSTNEHLRAHKFNSTMSENIFYVQEDKNNNNSDERKENVV